MRRLSDVIRAGLLGAAIFGATCSAAAVPAQVAGAEETAEKTATIPFNPPLGQKLRFRSQKTIAKDGKSRMQWSIADYQFDKAGEGYRLTVTPVENGTGSTEPMVKAIEQKLAALMNRPYVLTVSSEAVITGFEDADLYWDTVFDAVSAAIAGAGNPGEPLPPQLQTALAAMLKSIREMPAEARLALLTETVQPLVEFAATEWDSGSPVVTQIETPSPFGGQLKRDIRIALEGVDGDTAMMSLHSSVPREELEQLTKTALAPFKNALPPKDAGTLDEGINALDSFTHETRASYSVSLVDGVLLRHHSTETIEAGQGGSRNRRVTDVSLERIGPAN